MKLQNSPPIYDPGSLSGPIPGMSLTTEPGNRPWENPPQIVTVEDAIQFYSEKLLDPEKQSAIAETLEMGLAVESISDMLTTSAVMDGYHTIDISMLVTPVVNELIKYVGDINGVDYIESYEAKEKEQAISKREAEKIVKEISAEMNKDKLPAFPMPGKASVEESIEEPAMSKGLMARKPRGVEE
jgi:nucleoside permease NupC